MKPNGVFYISLDGGRREAIRRARKLARKKMQREGLLPMKPGWSQESREEAAPRAAPATDRGKRIRGARQGRPAAPGQLSTPVPSSPHPSSVGYTVATRGYSFREGQPAGPVIEGHADPIDHLLNDRVSLDTP
jgi:hypothetical protein